MSKWDKRWSDEHRAAIWHAWAVARILNQAQIGRLARAGELTLDGRQVPAFDIPDATVRQIIATERRRRQGREKTGLQTLDPGTAAEELRSRLIGMIDHETLRLERQQATSKTPIDLERVRKLAQNLNELRKLDMPRKPRGVSDVTPTEDPHSTAVDTLGGSLVAAMGEPDTAPGNLPTPPDPTYIPTSTATSRTDTATTSTPTHTQDDTHDTDHELPHGLAGSRESEGLKGLAAYAVVTRPAG